MKQCHYKVRRQLGRDWYEQFCGRPAVRRGLCKRHLALQEKRTEEAKRRLRASDVTN